MNRTRRSLLTAGAAFAAAFVSALTRPLQALAAEWNKAAFGARTVNDALKSAGIVSPTASADIVIKAPEIAENGAQVPVDIVSKVPGTDAVFVFVDKNPQPFVGSFNFKNGAEPFISTRIKMGETSNLRVVARARGKDFMAIREVKVTIGGCGA